MKKLTLCLALCATLHACASSSHTQNLTDLTDKTMAQDDGNITHQPAEHSAITAPSESMMIPDNAQKTPSGYVYVQLKPGTAVKPTHTDAVKVKLRALNIEGTLIDEAETLLAISHSTPFLEEILPRMTVGEQLRVWGESQARVWEIEILSIDTSFKAPEDVQTIPETAHPLPGFNDVYWRILTQGQGDNLQPGQVCRIYATRWNTQGEILESNKNSRGMLLFINDEYAQHDPIHHALVQHMKPGMHVRLWLPQSRLQTGFDIVEDFWIEERLPQLEAPKTMTPPTEDPNLIPVEPHQAWMRIENTGNAPTLTENQAVQVDMTCWNAQTTKLIDSTYLRGKPDIMDIRPELGIWQKIMMQVSVGTTFTTWINKSALPQNVNMDMVCHVRVLEYADK